MSAQAILSATERTLAHFHRTGLKCFQKLPNQIDRPFPFSSSYEESFALGSGFFTWLDIRSNESLLQWVSDDPRVSCE